MYNLTIKEIDNIRKILKNSFVARPKKEFPVEMMPSEWVTHNGSFECDMLLGPCCCGATH